MPRHVVLLRGINLGSHNRVAMPKLRQALEGAGYDEVATYLQSGNVVLSSTQSTPTVAVTCKLAIAEGFGLDVEVLARSKAQLAAIVKLDPLGKIAADPKRYQVTFLAARPKPELVRQLEQLAAGQERLSVHGRELYAWHPDGIGRSRLAARMAGRDLGIVATSRNWATVTALLELAS